MDAKEVVLRFVEHANAHDVDGLVALMADDHVFVNAAGETTRGRDAVEEMWHAYLAWLPDYRIDVERVVAEGDVVAICGSIHGTPAENPAATWDIPAAWLATVRGDRLSELRIYVDTQPMREAADPA
jgi:uncharacterized protein (TIGR02246 family)